MIIRQVSAEFHKCSGVITDRKILFEACEAAAARVGATVVGQGSAQYQPHGDTIVLFLAESHIMVTTWPEIDLALVDMLLCNEEMSLDDAIDELKTRLCPDGEINVQYVDRCIKRDVLG